MIAGLIVCLPVCVSVCLASCLAVRYICLPACQPVYCTIFQMDLPTIARMDPFELQLGKDPEIRAVVRQPQKIADVRNSSTNGTTESVKHAFEITNSHDYQVIVSAVWDLKRNNGNATSVSVLINSRILFTVCLSICLSVYLSVCLCLSVSVHLSTYSCLVVNLLRHTKRS